MAEILTIRQGMEISNLLTWALRDQGLGWGSPGKQDWTDLGTRVDTSWSAPAPSASLAEDNDAFLVRAHIDAMPPEAAALIIIYCRIGDHPDWCEDGVGGLVQEVDGRGRLLWNWDDPNDRHVGAGRSPRLVWQGHSRESVVFGRAQYELWWVGMRDLVAPLNAAMTGHETFGPIASRAPWNEVERVILHSAESKSA